MLFKLIISGDVVIVNKVFNLWHLKGQKLFFSILIWYHTYITLYHLIMNENKRSIYDIDPLLGESYVAKAVREANQLPDNERLKALSKLAKEMIGEA